MDRLKLLEKLQKFPEDYARDEIIEHCKTNETQTIRSLVDPFLTHVLGWNVPDPTQVRTEFGVQDNFNHGQKCDYALMVNGSPAVLIEVKAAGNSFNTEKELKQLASYFQSTEVELAILTNGLIWKWYSSQIGKKANLIDTEHVHEYNVRHPNTESLDWLMFVCRKSFDPGKIQVKAAIERRKDNLKSWTSEIFRNPTVELCELAISQNNLRVDRNNRKSLVEAVGTMIQETTRALLQNQSEIPDIQIDLDHDSDAEAANIIPRTRSSVGIEEESLKDEHQPEIVTGEFTARWKPEGGEWINSKTSVSVFLDVLQWLAGRHDLGAEHWCQKMENRWRNNFRITGNKPGRKWERLRIKGEVSFYVNKDLSNTAKITMLNQAATFANHKGKPVNMGTDLIVEMPNTQPRNQHKSQRGTSVGGKR